MMNKIGKVYGMDRSCREGRYIGTLAEGSEQSGESPLAEVQWELHGRREVGTQQAAESCKRRIGAEPWGKEGVEVTDSSVLQLLLVHGRYLGLACRFTTLGGRQGMGLGMSLFIVGPPLAEAEQHGDQLHS